MGLSNQLDFDFGLFFFLKNEKETIRTHNSSWIILKQLKGKIFSQFHLLSSLYSLLFVSFKLFLILFGFFSFSLIQLLRLSRQLKRRFLVLRSFILIFNHFFNHWVQTLLRCFLVLSKWQQHTLFDFFLSKNPMDS